MANIKLTAKYPWIEFSTDKENRNQQNEPDIQDDNTSPVPDIKDDGAATITDSYGVTTSHTVTVDFAAKTESELVSKYRDMVIHHECDNAVDAIVNEIIQADETGIKLKINLDKVEISENIKDKITEEHKEVLKLLDFNNKGYDIVRRWYVDGRYYSYAKFDPKNIKDGIVKLYYLDPRKTKKVRVVETKEGSNNITYYRTKEEYFLYNNKNFWVGATGGFEGFSQQSGLKIPLASVFYSTSGILDKTNQYIQSHLHKAIKPLNQLRILEDATVIYRISRAPERRVFNIDVGNLSKIKAEQYVKSMMIRHKNRLAYDATTGEIRDDRRFMTMLEDYWFAKRDGKGTQVETLAAGNAFSDLNDVEYFQKKLYKSLKVPLSRLESDSNYSTGRSNEITREEVKFQKFIDRLRVNFANLFKEVLRRQVIAKNIMNDEEWEEIQQNVSYDFGEDNFYSRLKDFEILKESIDVANQLENFIGEGKYFSNSWVRRNIFKQTDEEMKEQDRLIKKEKNQYKIGYGDDEEWENGEITVFQVENRSQIQVTGNQWADRVNLMMKINRNRMIHQKQEKTYQKKDLNLNHYF